MFLPCNIETSQYNFTLLETHSTNKCTCREHDQESESTREHFMHRCTGITAPRGDCPARYMGSPQAALEGHLLCARVSQAHRPFPKPTAGTGRKRGVPCRGGESCPVIGVGLVGQTVCPALITPGFSHSFAPASWSLTLSTAQGPRFPTTTAGSFLSSKPTDPAASCHPFLDAPQEHHRSQRVQSPTHNPHPTPPSMCCFSFFS